MGLGRRRGEKGGGEVGIDGEGGIGGGGWDLGGVQDDDGLAEL